MRFFLAIAAVLVLLLAVLSRPGLHIFAQSSATRTSTSLKPTHSPNPDTDTGCLSCLTASVKSVAGCAAIKDFNPTTFSDITSLDSDDVKACFCALASSQAWLTSCTNPAQCSVIFANAIQTAYNVTRGAVCANTVAALPTQAVKNETPGGRACVAQALGSAFAVAVLTML